MIESRALLAEAVLNSQMLLKRYLVGFDEGNRTTQPANLPNHAAWTLGHLAHTMGRVNEKLGGPSLPQDEFAAEEEKVPAGTNCTRFAADDVAFGSNPSGDPARYPSLARSVEIFDAACMRLAKTVNDASESVLMGSIPWGNMQITGYQAIFRMVFHNGTHTGQLADLRRAMGMKSIFA